MSASLTANRLTASRQGRRADVLRHLATGVRVGRGRDAPAALIAGSVLRAERTATRQVELGTSRLREAAASKSRTTASPTGSLV